jgi:hypothetical protein
MRLPRSIGMALAVALWGSAPASAGADGRIDPQRAGLAAAAPRVTKSMVAAPAAVSELIALRDRYDRGALGGRPDDHKKFQAAVEKLRKCVPVIVQKPVCHPRPKPPHGPIGWGGLTPIGFDQDRRGHDGHDNHHDHDDHGNHNDHGHPGHGPPICPSPH